MKQKFFGTTERFTSDKKLKNKSESSSPGPGL